MAFKNHSGRVHKKTPYTNYLWEVGLAVEGEEGKVFTCRLVHFFLNFLTCIICLPHSINSRYLDSELIGHFEVFFFTFSELKILISVL